MDISPLHRSLLFVPGANDRAVTKAPNLPADRIIFDLEDAVAPDAKPAALARVCAAITDTTLAPRALVRVNGLDSAHIAADLRALDHARPAALVFPKVETIDQVMQIDALLQVFNGFQNTQVWVMIETPLGVLNVAQIMAHPRVTGLIFGPNDLRKSLSAQTSENRDALQTSLSMCVLAARAYDKYCIDGVFNNFNDNDGLMRECAQGRMLGFDGKSLIHPNQIANTNQTFAPSDAEITHAQNIIAAFQSAIDGLATLNGEMIEELHVQQATALLKQAKIIKQQES
ncbi:citrate lyase subunit beta [Amylibacter ulvae]|uniref:Citrate lyase subunit beta n=1 Tax=Paramylibacter ulvae TaxID=1651968 RepID=A0ABQ3D6A2_9RHOB|nr:CoA ester lyase [Amylibacter ulvae]GHA61122.1 citrate lyase subunit beta [Amylibacter ulvae]